MAIDSPQPFSPSLPDDEAFARSLGVSVAAVQLVRNAEVIDLHVESILPHRLWGYDLFERHGLGLLGGHFFGHLDFPRILEGGLTGAMWSITSNVFRGAQRRFAAFDSAF